VSPCAWQLRSGRVLAALACLALGALVDAGADGASQPVASTRGSHVASRSGLLGLPFGAQGVVSAALGRDAAPYRVEGLFARNPAQGFSARFGRSGVAITAGAARFTLSLQAFATMAA